MADFKSGLVQQLKSLNFFWPNCKQNLKTTNFLNLGTLKRWQTQATLSLVVPDGRTLEPSLWYSYFLNRKPQTNYISFLHSMLMCHKGYAIFQLFSRNVIPYHNSLLFIIDKNRSSYLKYWQNLLQNTPNHNSQTLDLDGRS